MVFRTHKHKLVLTWISGAIVLGSLILLVAVVVLAIQNFYREKRYMTQLLKEKGSVLIRTFEAGSSTGILQMGWKADQLEDMLQAFSRDPEIEYIYITDDKGLIFAHSDPKLIGQKIPYNLREKASLREAKVRIFNKDEKKVFEVYKLYKPLNIACPCATASDGSSKKCLSPKNMHPNHHSWCLPKMLLKSNYTIHVGLDPSPYEAGIKQDIRNAFISSAILLMLGAGGIFFFLYGR